MKRSICNKTVVAVAAILVVLAVLAVGCGENGVNSGGESRYLNRFLDMFSKNPGGNNDSGETPGTHGPYTLSVNVYPTEGGTVSRSPSASSYDPGTQVTVTATPTAGYEFLGWSGASNVTIHEVTITMNDNMALSAGFGRIGANLPKYSVYFNPNNATGTPPETILRDSGSVVLLPNQAGLTKEWHSFAGWNTEADGTGRNYNASDEYTFIRTATLFAKWTRDTYTLTINAAAGGTTSPNPGQTTYNAGTDVTVTATAAQHYTFTGWSGASSSVNATVIIRMDENKTLTPNFSQNTYTLTTNKSIDGGGSVLRSPDTNSYSPGTEVRVTAAPAQGYTFTGWSGASNSTSASVTIRMDENKVLTAGFGIIGATRFTVTFNGNGAMSGNTPTNIMADSGAAITLPGHGNLERSGYRFGWWTANNTGTGTQYHAGDSYHVTSGITLFAKWIPIYTVTFNGNNATTGSAPTAMPADSGSGVTVPPQGDLSQNGHTFDGWNTRSDGTGINYDVGQSCVVTGNVTLYAKWTVISRTLTTVIYPSGGGTVSRSPTNQTSYNHGTTVIVTATAESCYTFTGWSGAATGSTNPLIVTMDGDKELIANFQQNLYTLVTHANEGSVEINPNKETYRCGERVTVKAIPNLGKSFLGWSGAATGMTNPLTITMDGNKELTANFNSDKYTLTIEPSSPPVGCSISRTLVKDFYDYGDFVKLTATAASCYTFTGWSGDASGTTNPLPITMDGHKKITANFQQKQYTLTTSVSPSSSYGSVSRSPSQTSYACGTSVTLTATPTNINYMFDSWTGATTGTTNPLTITMNDSKTLTAKFKVKKSETVTFPSTQSPYTFNKGFPATAEVYALGAGGGGQGGHSNYNAWQRKYVCGTGGAGGGGAVAYMELDLSGSTMFNVTVGTGGSEGEPVSIDNGLDSWRSGYKGGDGKPTIVKWNNNTLTVAGGKGGGEGRAVDNGNNTTGQIMKGGSGGSESTKPSEVSNWDTNGGGKGGDGAEDKLATSQGGKAGELDNGSRGYFGGGTGVYNDSLNGSCGSYKRKNGTSLGAGGAGSYNNANRGVKGGDGQVIIKFTWWE
jgi:uncharacterized repeat protein (TIGR02543 family)